MKIFLLLWLAAGLASGEKLDRTYLPPPGSKFSGGSPGDIKLPLELPKETYLTGQSRPQDGIPELELGINRRPKPVGSVESTTQKLFSYVPTTTTSYEISQTTTFAPPDYHGLESSSILNNTEASNPPQDAGQVYQQQPNLGQPDKQYQQGNQQYLIPYGSTTQRSRFESNRKPIPYLPPESSSYKVQTSSVLPSSQNSLAHVSPQPSYQDMHITTFEEGINQPGINQPDFTSPQVNQHNQFVGNFNVPSSTAAPQHQENNFGITTGPDVKQERFGSTVPTLQNQVPGHQSFPTSTTRHEYQDEIRPTTSGSAEQNLYVQNKNFPSSTLTPQHLGRQRVISPGSTLQNQYITPTTSPVYQESKDVITPEPEQHHFQQNENSYPGTQNVLTSTVAAQYQNGQQFTSPGSMTQNHLGNQNTPSSVSPQYQDGQYFVNPGVPQETIASNQQIFGSRIPNQKNINQYPGNRNFPSSTAASQFQNIQQSTTPGSKQSNHYFGNRIIPSTAFPQYQDGKRTLTPGVSDKFAPIQQVFGSRLPIQQNQNQEIQNFPPSTSFPQFTDSIGFTTPWPNHLTSPGLAQNQHQYQGHQNYPLSTIGSVPNQYISTQNVPTSGPHFQDGQRLNIPGPQEHFLNQQNQQYPATVAPQYQSTFASTLGSNQQGISSDNEYSPHSYNNQRFSSSTSSPKPFFIESQANNGNDGIQPGTISSSQPEFGSQRFSSPSDYNQAISSTTAGSIPTRGHLTNVPGLVSQERPERLQAASDRTAEILSYENVLRPEGYSYSFDTSNGIHADETGIVGDGTKAQGGFSYTGDDGKVYSVFYSADENGFQPRGEHLPTPPPIPEDIQRVIEQAKKDRESGISDDGSYNEEKYGYMKYDRKTIQLRPTNKTLSANNIVDTLDRYENRFGAQNKNKYMPETKNETYLENTELDINKEDQIQNSKLDDRNMKIQGEGEVTRRIPNKRPTNVKNIAIEDMKTKSINRNIINRPLVSDKYNQEGEISDDFMITGPSNGDEDLDSESDAVNYKDDPDSTTDFHGANKYLPNFKKVNKFTQLNKRPVLNNYAKPLVKVTNKQTKLNDHRSQDQTTVSEDDEELLVEGHIRNPSRKNKTNQIGKNQPKFEKLDNTSAQEELEDYTENYYIYTNGESEPDDEIQSVKSNRRNKPGNYERKNFITNEDDTKIIRDEETGYKYNPPQRNLDSEGEIKFPTRTSVTTKPKPMPQKGSQKTTIRPFMTPNLYGDEDEVTNEDVIGFTNNSKPLHPLRPAHKGTYLAAGKEGSRYNNNAAPKVPNDGQFNSTREFIETTPSRRPLGRPKYTPGSELNNPTETQNSQRPGNKVFYNNNVSDAGVSNVDSDAFVSTTPLPNSGSDFNKEYQLPGRFQTSIKPTDGTRFDEENVPGKDAIVNNGGSRFPSTTYRPNYTFGDRTLAPSESVSIDEFGRPISLGTVPQIIPEDISNNEPGNVRSNFRPGVGRFGGTTSVPTQGPGIQRGSTSTPKGEDFRGPKHPQGFDPETGYYYK